MINNNIITLVLCRIQTLNLSKMQRERKLTEKKKNFNQKTNWRFRSCNLQKIKYDKNNSLKSTRISPPLNKSSMTYEIEIPKSEIKKQLQIFKWRSQTNYPVLKGSVKQIIKTYNSDLKDMPSISLNVQIQNIQKSLKTITKLPISQSLYLLQQSCIGIDRLCHNFGLFKISQNHIFITQTMKCKVWINQIYTSNEINSKDIVLTQKQTVMSLIEIFKFKTVQTIKTKALFNQLQKSKSLIEVLRVIQNFVQVHKIKLPKRFIDFQFNQEPQFINKLSSNQNQNDKNRLKLSISFSSLADSIQIKPQNILNLIVKQNLQTNLRIVHNSQKLYQTSNFTSKLLNKQYKKLFSLFKSQKLAFNPEQKVVITRENKVPSFLSKKKLQPQNIDKSKSILFQQNKDLQTQEKIKEFQALKNIKDDTFKYCSQQTSYPLQIQNIRKQTLNSKSNQLLYKGFYSASISPRLNMKKNNIQNNPKLPNTSKAFLKNQDNSKQIIPPMQFESLFKQQNALKSQLNSLRDGQSQYLRSSSQSLTLIDQFVGVMKKSHLQVEAN